LTQNKPFERSYPVHVDALRLIRADLRDELKEFALSQTCQLDLLIAVGEVLQNIVRHAAFDADAEGWIRVSVARDGELIGITITDNAKPTDPATWQKTDASRIGGFGLPMVAQHTESHRFESLERGNRVQLFFRPSH